MHAFFLLLLAALAVPGNARANCSAQVNAARAAGKVLVDLPPLFNIPGAQWLVVEGVEEPVIVLTGLSEDEFRRAHETAKELSELLDMARAGNIRGYGRTGSAVAANRIASWGILFAAAAAGLFFVPEDARLVGWLAKGVAAFCALRTLRWMRTLDDNLTVETGMPESQLWSALGPTQGPLHGWLHHQSHENAVRVVLLIARRSGEAVAEWYRRRGDRGAFPDGPVVEIPLGR